MYVHTLKLPLFSPFVCHFLTGVACLTLDSHYKNQPKKFIERFLENKALSIEEIIALFERETANKAEIDALDVVKPISQIVVSARAFVANYAVLVNSVGNYVTAPTGGERG